MTDLYRGDMAVAMTGALCVSSVAPRSILGQMYLTKTSPRASGM